MTEEVKKAVVLVGGGYSIRQGLDLGLWDKLKHQDIEVWSLNHAFRVMPYLPSREIWIDISFFQKNIDDIEKLWKQGVKLHARGNQRYANLNHSLGEAIKPYEVTRERAGYKGQYPLKDLTPFLFAGRMGLVGLFALSLAVAEQYPSIYLLGYDFGTTNIDNTKTHFYQDELDVGDSSAKKNKYFSTGVGKPLVYRDKRNKEVKGDVRDFEVYLREPGIKIYNVSPQSNIPYFQKLTYPEFFERITPHE